MNIYIRKIFSSGMKIIAAVIFILVAVAAVSILNNYVYAAEKNDNIMKDLNTEGQYDEKKAEKLMHNNVVNVSSENYQTSSSAQGRIFADFDNQKTVLRWEAVPNAVAYKVSIKIGNEGKYREEAIVKNLFYVHSYSQLKGTARKLAAKGKKFIDVTENPLIYKVEPLMKIEKKSKKQKRKKIKTKIYEITADSSQSMEICNFESPIILSVKKKGIETTVRWSAVRNAAGYELYSGSMDHGKIDWHQVEVIEQNDSENSQGVLICCTKTDVKDTYFRIRAFYEINDIKEFSDYSEKYHYEENRFRPVNILYIGDSITFGSPYKKNNNIHVFSYPNQVADMTGADFLNASVPGITYGKIRNGRICPGLVAIVADRLAMGERLYYDRYRCPEKLNDNDKNQTFSDFDVIVLAGGDNDFGVSMPLGRYDDTSVRTMNGAVNRIMGYIKIGNKKRLAEGRKPSKVIFSEIIYGHRHAGKDVSRNDTANSRGLTLTDYQNDLYELAELYKKEGMDIYHFETKKIINENNYAVRTADNLHMTKKADKKYAQELVDFMTKKKIIQEDGMYRLLKMSNNDENDIFHMSFFI